VLTVSPESPLGVADATFTASFASVPENLATPYPEPPDPPFQGCRCSGLTVLDSPLCKAAGITTLSAGTLTLDGVPGSPITLRPSASYADTGYSATLPRGSLDGGILSVGAEGGIDVGPFQTSVTVPPQVQVTTSLSPGTVIDYHRPFSVTWSGGSPDTLVTMRLIAYQDQDGIFGRACTCPVLATEGTSKVDVFNPSGNELILSIGNRSENVEVVLTVTPLTSKLTRFAAPGLTRDGMHQWSYEYHFKGLKIR